MINIIGGVEDKFYLDRGFEIKVGENGKTFTGPAFLKPEAGVVDNEQPEDLQSEEAENSVVDKE